MEFLENSYHIRIAVNRKMVRQFKENKERRYKSQKCCAQASKRLWEREARVCQVSRRSSGEISHCCGKPRGHRSCPHPGPAPRFINTDVRNFPGKTWSELVEAEPMPGNGEFVHNVVVIRGVRFRGEPNLNPGDAKCLYPAMKKTKAPLCPAYVQQSTPSAGNRNEEEMEAIQRTL